jgi:hypothetical protein
MSKEQEIADRVAKNVIGGGLNVPAYNKVGRAVKVHIEVEEEANPLTGETLCRVGDYYFDAQQLDTFIDTLKMAQRRL